MKNERRKVLMAVFNDLACDGRVYRAATALAEDYEVELIGVSIAAATKIPGVKTEGLLVPTQNPLGRLSLARFWFRLLVKAVSTKPNIVYVHDFFLALPGWLIRKILDCRIVYDAHELIVGSKGESVSRSQLVFRVFERLVVHRADLVVAANRHRAEIMQKHYRLLRMPLVIQNIASNQNHTGVIASSKHSHFVDRTNRVRLVYQGVISLTRGIGNFVEALCFLDSCFELVLVGDGPGLGAIKDLVLQLNLSSRVWFTGKVRINELQDILQHCDIGIVTYSFASLNDVYCAPNKVFEYAHAGIPMVGSAQTSLRELVEGNRIGLVVEASDRPGETAMRYAGAILQVADNLEGYRSRLQDFIEKYSWEKEKLKLVSGVKRLQ